MKAVMGFRSHVGRDFSLPSSSLSPLAPPFMVERSNFGLISDPAVNLPETPLAMAMSGSPHGTGTGAVGHEFFPNTIMEFNKSLNPSSETHEYLRWKAADSANTNLPYLNPAVTGSKDPCLVGQGCYSAVANPIESKSYYPSYLGPATHGDSALVSPNESWSAYQSATLDESWSAYQSATLDESSQGVYAKKWMDSKPPSEWGGWTNEWRNGWIDWNQGKRQATDLFAGFSSKETNVTGSANYENLVSKGGGYCVTQALNSSAEILNASSINMHGGRKPTITGRAQSDDKSFLGNDYFSLHADLSAQTQPAIASEVFVDSGNHQMSYNASCSNYLSHHDKSYSFNTGSSGAETGMLCDLSVGIAAEDTYFSSSSNMNVSSSLPSFDNPAFLNSSENGTHLEKDGFTLSGNGLEASNKIISKDSLAHQFLQNCGHDISHISADFLTLALNTDRSMNSAEKNFDMVDRNNASVDSPCWKGASTSQYFPSEASDIVSTKYFKKNEEIYGSNDQVPHGFLSGIDDALQSGFRNRKKNAAYDVREQLGDSLAASMGSSVLSFASEEYTSDGPVKVGCCTVQVPTDICKRTAVHDLATDYDPADTGINECGPSENVEIHDTECALPSPSSPKVVPTGPAELDLEDSHPQADLQILVKTMHNLSELIRFHCLNGPSELKEHDQNLLKNVVTNVDACLLKNVKQIAQEKETALSQSDTLQSIEASVEDQQINGCGRPHLIKERSESSQTQLGKPNVEEVTEHCCKCRTSIAQSISARDTPKMMKEDNMTKELKRILDENLDDEEITEPQALLYRNLWLEAEAAFCSMNYKARFNRIKNEMERCFHQLEENTGTKKLPNPGVLFSSGEDSGSPTEAKNDLCHYPSAKDSPPSKTSEHINDVLVRFHFLKSRDESSYLKGSNEEEPSDFRSSDDHNKADESTDLEKGSVRPVDLLQDSLLGSKDMTEDVKDSVMARFNVRNSWADHLSVAISDRPIMTNIGEDEMLGAKMDKVPVLQGSYMVDKMSTPQDPHVHLACPFDLGLPSSCCEGTSSDWEHVTEDEFSG